ncbi:hypothetical protein [Asanoa hainanensis]|uniref:hypothetical protein n=1 Tax=Asanoa hainanensis TaxID=560556 RepID=UPI00117EAB30|nr:hypothetical protein [Asanoa hainanensis]
MLERVQLPYSTPGQRALAWLAAGYCASIAAVIAPDWPELTPFLAIPVLATALPAVIRPPRGFQVAIGLAIAALVPFSVLFYFLACVHLAAVIPLALAPTRAAARAPVILGVTCGALLLLPLGFLADATW